MAQENFNDLVAFVTVAREESFTKAAAKLGVSQSALSQTVRSLEERLGLRLLTRTTRRVSPTAAGERLLKTAGPRFEEIQAELTALTEMREKPAGTIRITAGEHAAVSILAPALEKILPDNPDVTVEIIVDYGLTDIVAERFDAGVRLGEQVAKDMIAVRISPEMRMAVVGSPSYFRQHLWPETPQDLTAHNCINMRLPTHGNIFPGSLRRTDANSGFASKAMAKLWVEAVNKHGGDAKLVHLPEIGIRGNTHFMFSDLNNLEIADQVLKFLGEKNLD